MPRRKRPKRTPWTRIGLTVIIGSVMLSLMRFYLSMAELTGDLDGPGAPQTREDIVSHFMTFLFAGQLESVLLYLGILLLAIGAFRSWQRN